jgi:hypothetical protein
MKHMRKSIVLTAASVAADSRQCTLASAIRHQCPPSGPVWTFLASGPVASVEAGSRSVSRTSLTNSPICLSHPPFSVPSASAIPGLEVHNA